MPGRASRRAKGGQEKDEAYGLKTRLFKRGVRRRIRGLQLSIKEISIVSPELRYLISANGMRRGEVPVA
jgi:hypothetical protein